MKKKIELTRTSVITHEITFLLLTMTLALAACDKINSASGTATTLTSLEQSLITWKRGDQDRAVQQFLETKWDSRPIFTAGTPLSYRESELQGMSQTELQNLLGEVMVELSQVKRLAAAVQEKGIAAAKTDPAFAQRCSTQLNQCGKALNRPKAMKIVQLTGQSIGKMAALETVTAAN